MWTNLYQKFKVCQHLQSVLYFKRHTFILLFCVLLTVIVESFTFHSECTVFFIWQIAHTIDYYYQHCGWFQFDCCTVQRSGTGSGVFLKHTIIYEIQCVNPSTTCFVIFLPNCIHSTIKPDYSF